MTTSIVLHTQEELTKSLADYMPGGKLFIAKNTENSNFHDLLKGLAGELGATEGFLKVIQDMNQVSHTHSLMYSGRTL